MKFSPENSEITIELFNLPNDIKIVISDRGTGIAIGDLDRLFDPFFQGKEVIGIKSGTGLGLPVVKKYLDALRGNISVKSKLGKGSVFTIILPKI